MNIFLIYGFSVLIISAQSRSDGVGSSSSDFAHQPEDVITPSTPPLSSPWSAWMNIKAPPVAFLKPSKKVFPPFGAISTPVSAPTEGGGLQEAPWTSWMKIKAPPLVTSYSYGSPPQLAPQPASTPNIEPPWAAWTNLKLGSLNPIAAKIKIGSSAESKPESLVTDVPARQIETATPDAEEKLLLKWAKKIFASQNNKLEQTSNKSSLLESAWEDWQKLHNKSDPIIIDPTAQALASDLPIETSATDPSKLVYVLQTLGIPPVQISDILTPSNAEISEKLKEYGVPPVVINNVLTLPPDDITNELLKIGILPPRVLQIMSGEPKNIPLELAKLGIPPEKIQELVTPPLADIRAKLEELELPSPDIDAILTPTPVEIMKKLEEAGVLDKIITTEPLTPKTPEILTVPQEAIAIELLKLGIPPLKILEILTGPPETVAVELLKFGVPPTTVFQILTSTPTDVTIPDSTPVTQDIVPTSDATITLPPPLSKPILISPELLITELQKLGLPSKEIETIVVPNKEILSTRLQELGLPVDEVSKILMPSVTLLESDLAKLNIPAEYSKLLEIIPNITAIIQVLESFKMPPSEIYKILQLPAADIPIALKSIGLPPEVISEIVTIPSIESIATELVRVGVPPDEISKIITPMPDVIIHKLTEIGIPAPKISDLFTPASEQVIAELQAINVPGPTIMSILSKVVVPKLAAPEEAVPQILDKIVSELVQLGIPLTKAVDIVTTPPYLVGVTLEKLGLPQENITQLLTPPPETILLKLQTIGVPIPKIVEIESLPVKEIPLELYKIGIPLEEISKILTPTPQELWSSLQETLNLPPPKIAGILTAPLEVVVQKLVEIGVSPVKIVQLVEQLTDAVPELLDAPVTAPIPEPLVNLLPPAAILTAPLEVIVQKLVEIGVSPVKIVQLVEQLTDAVPELLNAPVTAPTPEPLVNLLPPAAITDIIQELVKLGLTPEEATEVIKSPTPPTFATEAFSPPEKVELTIPQLQELIQVVLEECRKKSKAVRRTTSRKKSKYVGKKSGLAKPQSENKRALYPLSIPSPISGESTTKSPFGFIPSVMWDLVPTVAPNVSIIDPGYWAAKKAMFISKLFDALARVTMNYTNTETTTESPKQQLMKKIDTVLLSDAARSVKGNDDESEEMSTRDEDLVDSGEPENLPKEPDNPLHKLFKFGVQKTILSDISSTPVPPLISNPSTPVPTTTTASTLEQQKVILNKLKKLYQNTRASYKKSKNKSKKKLHGPKTTVSPIDFEELAKALLVQPSK
ncbi:titin isoform X2 [Folsomia candida]|uniref:titin isoform X2 n=1 Tax=Folsomia candida TaxID=158441 RepID=UPI000B8F05D2|nr:titin isoform X2 [Folsomia candida]